MIKNSFKKITILCLVLSLLLAMTACDSDPASDGSDIKTMEVSISIVYPPEASAILDARNAALEESSEPAEPQDESETTPTIGPATTINKCRLQVEEKATVMQILEAYSNQEGIPIQVSATDPHRVTAINGIKETKTSSWSYEINGKVRAPEDAAADELEDGDHVTWKYGETE